MLGVFAARAQTENNGPGSIGEKTERVLCGYATEMLYESIVGELAGLGKTVHAFVDFDDNVSAVDEVLMLVLLHDAGRNDFDWVSHVFVLVHGKFLMSIVMSLALGVDRTLLKRMLAVVMSAVGVFTSPNY
jgi:hypothetical protein